MKERRNIVALWQRGDPAVLVTLVAVEGSSYRRPGARMLIAHSGEFAGSISGGCLEAEVLRKAQWHTRHGAVIKRFSTLFDDTADIPYGLGCGGTVDLLLEPADTPECEALLRALADSLSQQLRLVTTLLPEPGRPLTRRITSFSGDLLFASAGLHPTALADAPADGVAAASCAGVPSFTESLDPPQRLFLFGAGDDAQPLVSMAALLGWEVTVIDGRSHFATTARFPQAGSVLALAPGAPAGQPRSASQISPNLQQGIHTFANLRINHRDAVVLMTHSYEQDRAWLAALLPLQPRYLGLLGARHRSALLVSEVAALLGWSVDRVCSALFAPVGMDLGGDGAEAIALAILAEIQACCQGRLGISRRLTPAAVSEQVAQGGVSRYLQLHCPVGP